MLIILAGITLNAVIGENGIIFQAKETKNLVTNETTYDNQQLAQLQNELKDNGLYSGIGIIPGTDTGGSSEGGENGTTTPPSGNQNTGGNPSRPTPDNTGGGQVPGLTAKDPTIYVLAGEEIAASVYRTDVTLQIITPEDKMQKIKYVLNTSVEEINKELYPSGLIRELDIENGGTLTLTKEGEYTLTAYAYDSYGNKSNATAIWLKIQKSGSELGTGISVTLTSGIEGKDGWYTSNLTYRVLGQDKGSSRVTYRVTGMAKSNGRIDKDYQIGELDTGEVDIANGTTFRIEVDGEFEIRAYTYDNGGTRLSELAVPIQVKRDASKPIILTYAGNQEIKDNVSESGFLITLNAQDLASGLATTKKYTYRNKLASVMDYNDEDSEVATKLYQRLAQDKTYDMYALVRDQAGNIIASDIISKPALWVSSNPTVGESVNGGQEGARVYYSSSNVDVSMTAQDKKTVNIGKVTYQILGTTTSEGEIDRIHYPSGTALTTDEHEMDNQKTIPIRADGNWTIKIHTYDANGKTKVSTNTLEVSRDTIAPEPPVFIASGEEGKRGYYKADSHITATGTDATSFKKITYQIAKGGATVVGETDIQNGETFELPITDGTYSITGYVYDKSGRKSALSQPLTIIRDTVKPVANTPSATTANAEDRGEVEGTTSYFKGDVQVQLNGGTDSNPLLDKMTCIVTGTATKAGKIQDENIAENQTINKTIETTKNGTFAITADGRWTITTYCYDYAGNTSDANTITVVKDTVAPTIHSFDQTEQRPKDFTMTVNAEDTLSGLAKTNTYTYSIVTSPETAPATDTSNAHKYDQNLDIDTEYNVRVIVKDKAGNTKEATNKVKTKNGYFLKDVAKVGDYVDYFHGSWRETRQAPTVHGQLGNVTMGQSTSTRVKWYRLWLDGI